MWVEERLWDKISFRLGLGSDFKFGLRSLLKDDETEVEYGSQEGLTLCTNVGTWIHTTWLSEVPPTNTTRSPSMHPPSVLSTLAAVADSHSSCEYEHLRRVPPPSTPLSPLFATFEFDAVAGSMISAVRAPRPASTCLSIGQWIGFGYFTHDSNDEPANSAPVLKFKSF